MYTLINKLQSPRLYVLPFVLAFAGVIVGFLIARLSWPNVFLLLAFSAVAVGSVIEPLVGVGAAMFFGPMWAWLRAELPQVPPLIGQYMFLLAVGAWGLRALNRRALRFPCPPLLLPLLAFMGVALLSLWSPSDVWVGLWEWLKWAQVLLMFLLVYDRIQPARSPEALAVIVALVLAALFQAAVGLWQFGLRGTGPEHFAISEQLYRAYGTFEQPNPYAGFLGMVGAVVVGIVLSAVWDCFVAWRTLGFSDFVTRLSHPARYVWGAAVAAVLIGTALAASWSRGAWMGFGAALLVMLALLPRKGLWGLLLVAILLVSGFALYRAGWLPAPIAQRLTGFLAYTRFEDVRGAGINDANFAVLERMAHWQAALEMWQANFWLGVGFGCYEPAYPAYALINWPLALGHAHNYYLNLLAETGMIGLVTYASLLVTVFVQLGGVSRRLTGWARGVVLGLTGAWVHFCVHNLVDNILVNNVHLHVGVLLALSACFIKQKTSKY